MSSNLVTVASFQNALEAHMLKDRLEAEDIHCLIANEQAANLTPLPSIALGGITVQVNPEDAARAEAIYQEIQSTPTDTDSPSEDA